ncbi:MAG: hypothetical protein HQK49_16370 [Oligoflexia bacterium]|nr:hypothetical protein [Oligoflexia bacterium]
MKTVIPFYPKAIINSDGDTKNDCEKNAAKRFIINLKEDHPKLNLIVAADSLYSDTVFIALLKRSQLSYVLNAKPGKNKYLFESIEGMKLTNAVTSFETEEIIGDKIKKKMLRKYTFVNDIRLTSEHELKVNFLDFEEIITWENKKGLQEERVHFSWVSDIEISKDNAYNIMKIGRVRWKPRE